MAPVLRTITAAAAALVLGLTGCSSGGDRSSPTTASSSQPTSAPTTTAPPAATFTLTGGIVRAPDPRMTTFPSEVVVGVQSALDAYLDRAVLAPLRSGGPAPDLSGLFAPAARPRLEAGSADRAALVDEGLPAARDLRVERAVADVGAVAGPQGRVGAVLASLDLTVTGRIGSSGLTIRRTGEVSLGPYEGAWKIDYFKVTVTRHSEPEPGSAPTTRP